MIYCSPHLFDELIRVLVSQISRAQYTGIYGVPRGGIYVAIALSRSFGTPVIEKDHITDLTLIVDDLIDSGATRRKFPNNDFACLYRKTQGVINKGNKGKNYIALGVSNDWIEFFWEREAKEQPAEDAVIRLIEMVGEDPNREGLQETPKRVMKSYETLFSGYKQTPEDIIKTFDGDGYDQIVLLKDIEMYSMCEHHLLPFVGKAHVAYIPGDRLVGISKLARLVEIYSRRMQIQERIGEQVTSALMKYLNPIGAACIIEATHLCMRMRGVQKQNSTMVTSSLKGVFLDELSPRNELMRLIR